MPRKAAYFALASEDLESRYLLAANIFEQATAAISKFTADRKAVSIIAKTHYGEIRDQRDNLLDFVRTAQRENALQIRQNRRDNDLASLADDLKDAQDFVALSRDARSRQSNMASELMKWCKVIQKNNAAAIREVRRAPETADAVIAKQSSDLDFGYRSMLSRREYADLFLAEDTAKLDAIRNDDEGNPTETAAIGVNHNPLDLSAVANSTSVSVSFVVANIGASGSTLNYSVSGSFREGSIAFSRQSGSLGHQQSDTLSVTVNRPGGFQAGQTYNGSITVSSTDGNVAAVVAAVRISVAATPDAIVGTWRGIATDYTFGEQVAQVEVVIDSSFNVRVTGTRIPGVSHYVDGVVQSTAPFSFADSPELKSFDSNLVSGSITEVQGGFTTGRAATRVYGALNKATGKLELRVGSGSNEILTCLALAKQ